MSECCLLLRGEFFIRDSLFECAKSPNHEDCDEKSAQYIKVGNTSTCEVRVDSQVVGRENIFNRANPKSRLLINGVDLNLIIECVSRDNLLQAFYSENDVEDSFSVSDRVCLDRENPFIFTKYTPSGLAITALDSFGNEVRPLIEGIDYTLNGSKIELLTLSTLDEIVENLSIDYSFDPSTVLSFRPFSATPKYKDVFFKGENKANGDPVEVRFYRVLFNPLRSFDLISKDQFFNLPLEGVVEESNQGYFKLTLQKGGGNGPGSIIY